MEERKTPVCVHVMDEASITIPVTKYDELMRKAVCYDTLYGEVKAVIDTKYKKNDYFRKVDEDFVLSLLGLKHYPEDHAED